MLFPINEDCYFHILSFLDVVSLIKMKILNNDNKNNKTLEQMIQKYIIKGEEEKHHVFERFINTLIDFNKDYEKMVLTQIKRRFLTIENKEEILKSREKINFISIGKYKKASYHNDTIFSYNICNLNDKSLFLFFQTLPNVNYCNLYYLQNITYDGITRVLDNNTNLRYISFVYCSFTLLDFTNLRKKYPDHQFNMYLDGRFYNYTNYICDCDTMRYH
jgi:hypothetical protein